MKTSEDRAKHKHFIPKSELTVTTFEIYKNRTNHVD